jgi:hypothetical protein
LYLYLPNASDGQLEFTVLERNGAKAVVETTMRGPPSAGVKRIQLADFDVHLETDVIYAWSVALVPDAFSAARFITTGGEIQRIVTPPELEARLATANVSRVPFVLADAGIWYDAIDRLSKLIDTYPDDPALLRQRASLLEQVGLTEVAEVDRVAAAGL